MSGFVKSAGNAAAAAAATTNVCASRSNANLCLSSFISLQSSLRLRDSSGSSSSREGTPYSSRPGALPIAVNGREELDELPEGPLVTRKIVRCSGPDLQDSDPSQSTCIKEAEYLLSFPVIGENGEERVDYMKNHLAEMRESNNIADKAKPVLLMISLSGIKVCSNNGESVYMAHALKRISYATCQPEHCQFSFLAREPKAHGLVQYCHTFLTKTPDEATKLNSIVAQAFTIAYTNKRADGERPALTFHDVIQNQMEACREQFEENSKQKQEVLTAKFSQISTPHVDQIAQQRKERRLKEDHEDSDHKPANDRLRLQAQISGENSPALGSPVAYMKVAMSLNLDSCPDVDQRTLNSISRILEALNSGEARVHGSPVTILKDTIDAHFKNGLSRNFSRSPVNSFEDNLSPFSPVSSSTLLCETSDLGNVFHATNAVHMGDGLNAFPLKSSQKPSQGCRVVEPQGASKWSQDQRRSKPLQTQETAVVADLGKANRKMQETRDEAEICDGSLQDTVWYRPGIAREIVLDMLSQQEPGLFIVRDSLTHPGCYALSIKLPTHDSCTSSDIAHYLITKTPRGTFKLKGLAKEWNSLMALVTHHTVMKEILPCLLILPSSTAFKNTPVSNKHEQSHC